MEVRLSREEDLKTVHPFLMKEKKTGQKIVFSLTHRHARTHAGIYTHILSLYLLFLSLSLSHTHTHSFSSDPFFDERPDNPIQQEGL